MVRLTAEVKRGFLNALYIQAKNATVPLQDALSSFLLNSFGSVQTGRLVVSHAGAGKSTVFETPSIFRSFTQEEIFGLAYELTEVYTDATVTQTNWSAQQKPPITNVDLSDPTIFAVMMQDDRLQDINRVTPDFTTLLIWPR